MDCDIAIIGAGVIGLAIASEIADCRTNIYIIEKNESHGRGISSRNSEVIHAGIYYPPDSLKAKLCVEGNWMLYEICKENKIPYRKIGKLIIATSVDEEKKVEQLLHNARQNGVSSVCLLEKRQISEIEPNIIAMSALYSPATGIINVHALMDYYLYNARMKGAEIVYCTKVVEIERVANGYKINTLNKEGEYFKFVAGRVINSAGLNSDDIAGMIGKDYRLHYCKGDYFSIDNVKREMVQRLIYPVPEKNHVGLGVHLTFDLNGRMRLGPDATYIDRIEDYRVDAKKREKFYASAVKFLPFIRSEDIVPDMSGIRPKLQGNGDGFRDFMIREDLPGFINLVGIESPGLTASPAIARYVKTLLDGGE